MDLTVFLILCLVLGGAAVLCVLFLYILLGGPFAGALGYLIFLGLLISGIAVLGAPEWLISLFSAAALFSAARMYVEDRKLDRMWLAEQERERERERRKDATHD